MCLRVVVVVVRHAGGEGERVNQQAQRVTCSEVLLSRGQLAMCPSRQKHVDG